MNKKINNLNKGTAFTPDVLLQGCLLLPTLFYYLDISLSELNLEFWVIALSLQAALAGVQLFSGLYYLLRRRSTWHRTYVIIALSYLLFLLLGALVIDQVTHLGTSDRMYGIFVFCVFVVAVPMSIAIWYFIRSIRYHKNYRPDSTFLHEDSELLDDQFYNGDS